MDRGFTSSLEKPARDGQIDVEFKDIRTLHIVVDRVKKLIHILNINRKLAQRMRTFFGLLRSVSSPECIHVYHECENDIEDCILQNEVHTAQLASLVSRAEGVGSLVRKHPSNYLNVS